MNEELSNMLDARFPKIDPGIIPLGGQVVLQIALVPDTILSSGIILTSDVQQNEQYARKSAKVIAMGPVAFKSKLTGELWTGMSDDETSDYNINLNDYVISPHVAGSRYQLKLDENDPNSKMIHFVACKDTEVQFKIRPEKVLKFERGLEVWGA